MITKKLLVLKKSADRDGNNPIHLAAMYGHIEIVKYFLENRVALLAGNRYDSTPFCFAVTRGNEEIVKIMVEVVPEDHIFKPYQYRMNVLHIAAQYGYLKIVKQLCNKIANLNVLDDFGNFPIHYAAANGRLETVKYLTRYKSTLNVPSRCGLTPLQFATKTGHSEIAEYLTKVEGGLIDHQIESATE